MEHVKFLLTTSLGLNTFFLSLTRLTMERKDEAWHLSQILFVYGMDAFVVLIFLHIILCIRELVSFSFLPTNQLGNFSINRVYARLSIMYTVIFALITSFIAMAIFIYTQSEHDVPLHRYLIPSAVISLPILVYIAYRQHLLYIEVCRRASLIYITSQYINIEYYNAERLCDEFNLVVFPIKTYEALYEENPGATSLYTLYKELDTMRRYEAFRKEIITSRPHLLAMVKAHIPPVTVQS
jgi:hypothetical protein